MNKSYLIAVLTLTCLLGLGISAHAQDAEGVRVKIPFGFVAGGTTFPAGTYTVGRVAPETSQLLSIRSYDIAQWSFLLCTTRLQLSMQGSTSST